MSSPDPQAAGPVPAGPSLRSLPARLWRKLRSLRFALVLMVLIALACVVGTLVKQEPYEPNEAIAQYGKPFGLLVGLLGLHQLYHTWWFLALLLLFALSAVACALRRLRLRLRTLGSAVVHFSIVFIVAGAIVRALVGVEGLVEIAEGEAADSFPAQHGPVALGFRLRLDDFEIERYEGHTDVLLVLSDNGRQPKSIPVHVGKVVPLGPDGTTVEILRTVAHFVYSIEDKKVISASDQPVNPAVRVRVRGPAGESTRWLFARFPDSPHGNGAKGGPQLRYVWQQAPVKTYASHVSVLDEQGGELRRATILVNQPLKVGRFTFYQSGYDKRTERSTVLEVVYDPGVSLVFVGFVLMPLGIAYVFYIQPLWRRKGRENA